MKCVSLLVACAAGLSWGFVVPSSSHGVSRLEPRSGRTVVKMTTTGSQVAWRIRRKRLQNQQRGRLRLNVFRSHNHIYAQVIDDEEGHTLAACSTLDAEVKSQITKSNDIPAAAVVGKRLAEILKEKGIEQLYYDRFSGSHKYLFHGRIKALVDGVREGGITV
mmetsp:Transcript_19365/g.60917  ORF Transcript_19365/g.60917 Transcript_19365/m.60917 type:complete len:163 (+) Transcript_19365:20-508(+)